MVNLGFQRFSELEKEGCKRGARLLYLGVEKEYKQAKLKAAKTFRVHFLPANFEVAIEFDRIAEENEGTARKKCLIQMRIQALEVIKQNNIRLRELNG